MSTNYEKIHVSPQRRDNIGDCIKDLGQKIAVTAISFHVVLGEKKVSAVVRQTNHG